MAEYEDKIRAKAKEYAAAQQAVEDADRQANTAKTRADNCRIERDKLEKELAEFVGRNIPRRIIAIPESTRAVLIEMDLREPSSGKVFVSLEAAL